jgi:hypothetical protein
MLHLVWFFLFLFIFLNITPSFSVVDMNILLNSASSKLAKSYPNGQVPKEVIQSCVTRIQEHIQDFGKKHHNIIFSKGAILAGKANDITPYLLGAFKNSEDINNVTP